MSQSENLFLEATVERLRRFPEQVYCVFVAANCDDRIITNRVFLGSALAFAGQMVDLPRGSTVLLFMRHNPEMHSAYFGAMLAGCVPSFMPCTSPRQDVGLYWQSHQILIDSIRPAAILAGSNELGEIRDAGLDLHGSRLLSPEVVGQTECTGESNPAALDASLAATRINAFDEVCLLQHSSGTTGLKKGVCRIDGSYTTPRDTT